MGVVELRPRQARVATIGSASINLVDAAIAVIVARYHLTEEDAIEMLRISSRTHEIAVTDLASWLVYDGDGHYYPEPGPAEAT